MPLPEPFLTKSIYASLLERVIIMLILKPYCSLNNYSLSYINRIVAHVRNVKNSEYGFYFGKIQVNIYYSANVAERGSDISVYISVRCPAIILIMPRFI